MHQLIIIYIAFLTMYTVFSFIISILVSILGKRDGIHKITRGILSTSIHTASVCALLLVLIILVINEKIDYRIAIVCNVVLSLLFIIFRFDSTKEAEAIGNMPNDGLALAIRIFYIILTISDSFIVSLFTALSVIGALIVVIAIITIGTMGFFEIAQPHGTNPHGTNPHGTNPYASGA